jgi:uncharacterized BrkB/YihY/UPF0761 family membrane protein
MVIIHVVDRSAIFLLQIGIMKGSHIRVLVTVAALSHGGVCLLNSLVGHLIIQFLRLKLFISFISDDLGARNVFSEQASFTFLYFFIADIFRYCVRNRTLTIVDDKTCFGSGHVRHFTFLDRALGQHLFVELIFGAVVEFEA